MYLYTKNNSIKTNTINKISLAVEPSHKKYSIAVMDKKNNNPKAKNNKQPLTKCCV